MNKTTKLLLSLGTVATISGAAISTVSCGHIKPEDSKPFDVGLAVSPLSSLNYIKYKSAVPVANALVEGFGKQGAKHQSPLENVLKTQDIVVGYRTADSNHTITVSTRIANFARTSGTLRGVEKGMGPSITPSEDNVPFLADGVSNDHMSAHEFQLALNGLSKWSNGEMLISSNFIDAVAYITDLNTASKNVEELLSIQIGGARKFIDVQNRYALKYNTPYVNPFGYENVAVPAGLSSEARKVWTVQQQSKKRFPLQRGFKAGSTEAQEEQDIVNDIEVAARTLGIYGDQYSSHPQLTSIPTYITNQADIDLFQKRIDRTNNWNITETTAKYSVAVPGQQNILPYKVRIIPETQQGIFNFSVNGIIGNKKGLMPVNRNFVEATGGIEKFGSTINNFLTEGAFNIESTIFGANGNMMLKKNQEYWDKENTIPNSVKLFFLDDANVKVGMFEDGYISTTTLNPISVRKLFSDTKMRPLILKTGGLGTTSLMLNLDKNTNTNKNLLDLNFRRALMFALNRPQIINQSEFPFTYPEYSFLSANAGTRTDWLGPDQAVPYIYSSSTDRVKLEDGKPDLPLYSGSVSIGSGAQQMFANYGKVKDKYFDIERARIYIEKFKKANPGTNKVKIQFVHDSTDGMVNMALEIKSQLQAAFGGFVELDIKGYPKSIYTSYITQGKFDMTWKNFDYLASNKMGGLEGFFIGDGVKPEIGKSNGFSSNPTGSWTMRNLLEDLKVSKYGENESQYKARLNISDVNWDRIKLLSKMDPSKGDLASQRSSLIKRLNMFLNVIKEDDLNDQDIHSLYSDKFDSNVEISELMRATNIILVDQAVTLPVFRVDIVITASRISGFATQSNIGKQFDYAYDLLRKPRPDLPGMEVLAV